MSAAPDWIRAVLPKITTLAQCMDSRIKVREQRGLGKNRLATLAVATPVDDVWLNVAISRSGDDQTACRRGLFG